MQNITKMDPRARDMANKGRNGDTEMAHVTPGEIVVPHSVQTPQLKSGLNQAFMRAGVPMERYTVRGGASSRNPRTGNEEYFNIGKALTGLVKGGIGFATGGPAGALAGAPDLLGAFSDGGGSSGGGGAPSSGGGTAAGGGSILPAPVQANNTMPRGKDYFGGGGGDGYSLPPEVMAGTMFPPAHSGESSNGGGKSSNDVLSILTGILPMLMNRNSSNPFTGKPEFYDTGMYRNATPAMNPSTGKQEFASTPPITQIGRSEYVTLPNGKQMQLNPTTAQMVRSGQMVVDPTGTTLVPASSVPATTKPAASSTSTPAPAATTPAPTAPTPTTSSSTPKASTSSGSTVKMSGAGIPQDANQAAKRAAGYTGGFTDANEFQQWARENPAGYLKYLEQGGQQAGFTNPVDLDPVTPGQQTWSRDINDYLGTTIGWEGDVGQGQLGSGIEGVDYLSLNPQYVNQYSTQRKLADPNYNYTSKTALPSDFNADYYLQNNPTVAADIASGKYTGPGGSYYAEGQKAGYSYSAPQQTSSYNPQPSSSTPPEGSPIADDNQGNSQVNPDANAALSRVSSLSPVRTPRFRSRRMTGSGYAANF